MVRKTQFFAKTFETNIRTSILAVFVALPWFKIQLGILAFYASHRVAAVNKPDYHCIVDAFVTLLVGPVKTGYECWSFPLQAVVIDFVA